MSIVGEMEQGESGTGTLTSALLRRFGAVEVQSTIYDRTRPLRQNIQRSAYLLEHGATHVSVDYNRRRPFREHLWKVQS